MEGNKLMDLISREQVLREIESLKRDTNGLYWEDASIYNSALDDILNIIDNMTNHGNEDEP